MQSSKLKYFILLAIPVVLYFSFSGYTNTAHPSTESTLDPITDISQGLALTVQSAVPSDSFCIWVPTSQFESSSLIKVPRFPRNYSEKEIVQNDKLKYFTINPISNDEILSARVVKNERFSGQIAISTIEDLTNLKAEISNLKSDEGHSLSKDNTQIRYVGYVPIQRAASEYSWSAKFEEVAGAEVSGMMNPDIVADPLFVLDHVKLPAFRTQPIWISIDIPAGTSTGVYKGTLTISSDQFSSSYKISIEVVDLSLPDPKHYQFYLDLWFNANSIATNHEVEPWSQPHWNLVEKYLKELASLGGKTITTIISHEPWRIKWLNDSMRSQTHTGFEGMIKWRLHENNTWNFDYSIFDRFVELSKKSGFSGPINTYSLTAFRGKERISYFDVKSNANKTMYFASVEDPAYRDAWKSFLTDFKQHLQEKDWLNETYLCFDERPNETMENLTKFIKEVAPEFGNRISIAGHPESSEFASGSLSISYEFFPNQNLSKKETFEVIEDRNDSDKMTTFYICGQPAHPNTLTYSPAIESRMLPWMALKYNVDGLLRWSYNSWPADPYTNPVFNFIEGDEYLIYPGKTGPVSSIRWELLRDGIEDFELYNLMKSTQNSSEESKLSEAIDLATRNEDGRNKDVMDIKLARRILEEIE